MDDFGSQRPTQTTAPVRIDMGQLAGLYTPGAGINPGPGYSNPFAPVAAPPPANVPNATPQALSRYISPFQSNDGEAPGYWSDPYRGTRGPGEATPGFASGGGLTETVLYGTPRPESTGGNARTGRTAGGIIGGLIGGPMGGLLGAGLGHVVGGQIGRTQLPPTIGYRSGRGGGSGPTLPISSVNRVGDGTNERPERYERQGYTSGIVERTTGRMVGGV